MKNITLANKATDSSLQPLKSIESVLHRTGLTRLRVLLMVLVVGSLSGAALATDPAIQKTTFVDQQTGRAVPASANNINYYFGNGDQITVYENSGQASEQSIEDGAVSVCQPSEAARDAIAAAEQARPPGADKFFQFRDLIRQAEHAARPPQCDSGKAIILAQKALRLTGDSAKATPATPVAIPTAIHSPSTSHIVEFNLSQVNFNDSSISGSVFLWGLTLGRTFDSRYELAYSYSQKIPLISPSMDSPSELDDHEFLDVQMHLLSLRRNWKINDVTTAFALVGYSKVKIKIDNLSLCVYCGFTVSSNNTYRNSLSGPAWGVGMQWKTRNNLYRSLEYMDHSDKGFGFSGVHLNFGWLY